MFILQDDAWFYLTLKRSWGGLLQVKWDDDEEDYDEEDYDEEDYDEEEYDEDEEGNDEEEVEEVEDCEVFKCNAVTNGYTAYKLYRSINDIRQKLDLWAIVSLDKKGLQKALQRLSRPHRNSSNNVTWQRKVYLWPFLADQ